jgi:hypothetical protein
MRSHIIISFGSLGFAASATAQAYFEPGDFNITAALLENGITLSALPQIHELEHGKRSYLNPCAAAVCHTVIVSASTR